MYFYQNESKGILIKNSINIKDYYQDLEPQKSEKTIKRNVNYIYDYFKALEL